MKLNQKVLGDWIQFVQDAVGHRGLHGFKSGLTIPVWVDGIAFRVDGVLRSHHVGQRGPQAVLPEGVALVSLASPSGRQFEVSTPVAGSVLTKVDGQWTLLAAHEAGWSLKEV